MTLDQYDGTKSPLEVIFTDIDDTLTHHGKLKANAYQALWELNEAGLKVVPITGRPAGWCELIARIWPVYGVVGENGAFYFRYENKKMHRWYAKSEDEWESDRDKLKTLETEILKEVPGTAVASDQFSRIADLAIDFSEDVEPLSQEDVRRIVDIFQKHGAQAKVSSIHVNGWFGDYNKLTTTKVFAEKVLGFDEEEMKSKCCFCGDSPNDEPMFAYFPLSFGVANIKDFQLDSEPRFVAPSKGGDGFSEIAQVILSSLSKTRGSDH